MPRSRLKLYRPGIRKLLKSDEMVACCLDVAGDVAGTAEQISGVEGYTVAKPHKTKQRVIVNVYPGTKEAARDNYYNDTLLKVVYR